MPAHIWLHQWASLVYDAFKEVPYHVGSSVTGKVWRDVDVRVILPMDKWERFIDENYQEGNGFPNGSRRAALELAFTELGRKITGLPIDFQIQNTAVANKYDGPRSALGVTLHHHCSAEMDCPDYARPRNAMSADRE